MMQSVVPSADAVRRRHARLLDQQLWCLGQDILRKEGNLLVEYGFTKHRPVGVEGCTAYVLRSPESGCVVLWGFGVYFSVPTEGSIFIRRFDFRPLWNPHHELPKLAWIEEDLPPFRCPDSPRSLRSVAELTIVAANWMARYEDWVLDRFGLEYRQECLRLRERKPFLEPGNAPAAWRDVAAVYEVA